MPNLNADLDRGTSIVRRRPRAQRAANPAVAGSCTARRGAIGGTVPC